MNNKNLRSLILFDILVADVVALLANLESDRGWRSTPVYAVSVLATIAIVQALANLLWIRLTRRN